MNENYIDALADAIRERTPPELLPDDAPDLGHLFRLYALLGLVKGESVTTRDVHDAWTVWMLERGESHESIVPFDRLSPSVQDEDKPFLEAILAALASADEQTQRN